MADTISLQLLIDTGKSAQNIEELEQSIEAMRDALKKTEIGSKEFDKLAREVQKAEGKIKDIERTYESADLEGRMGRLGDVVGGVTRGFGAAQGALLLLGEEGEESQKIFEKMMAAMAIADSIEGFAKLASAIQKMGNVTKIATGIQAAFNVVLNLNPIGLIVIAVAALVAGIVLLIDPIRQAIDYFRNLNGWAKVLVTILGGPLIAVIWGVTEALEALGIIQSEEEAAAEKAAKARSAARVKAMQEERDKLLTMKNSIEQQIELNDSLITSIDRELAVRSAAGEETEELERRKLEVLLDSAKKQLEIAKLSEQAAAKSVDVQREIFGDFITEQNDADDDFLKEKKENIAASEKALYDSETAIMVFEAKVQKKRNDNARAAAQERKQIAEDLARRQRELLLEAELIGMTDAEKEYTLAKRRFEENIKGFKEGSEGYLAAVKIFRDEEQEILAKAKKANQDLLSETEKAVPKAAQTTSEAFKEVAVNMDMAAKGFSDLTLNQEKDWKAIAANVNDRLELTKSGLQAISDLADAFAGKSEKQQRRAFNIQKAASIAIATIETFQAAQKAYSSQIIPLDPSSIPRAVIAAAITTAAGLARVAKIARTKFEPSGGGGGGASGAGGGGGGGTVTQLPPRLAAVGSTTIDANRDQVQDMTVKVVESDIKGVMARVNVVENQAKIK